MRTNMLIFSPGIMYIVPRFYHVVGSYFSSNGCSLKLSFKKRTANLGNVFLPEYFRGKYVLQSLLMFYRRL